LTLDFSNGSFKFRVTPLQASIIAMFNAPGIKALSADQIAKELDITAEEVRKRGVAFWVCKGVLREQRVFKQLGTAG
jgi:intracellular sulfur oxidation DsrE/DsrF family protein